MARKSRKNIDLDATPPTPQNKVYSVGMYVRLSSEDRKCKGDSIENQQGIIQEFIDGRSDLELREIYIDDGISGQVLKRPAFTQLQRDIKNGLIDCCITKDLSRLGRNAIDTGYYSEIYFPRYHVRYIAINDGYDSANGQAGSLMMSLKNMVNEAIAIETGRKIKATAQRIIHEGGFMGAFPPYGYLKAQDNVHRLVPDEYAKEIVLNIFNMYRSGSTVVAILEWLNKNEILSPLKYFYSKGIVTQHSHNRNFRWSRQMIGTILSNQMYCGDMVQGVSAVVNHSKKVLPKSEWVITKGMHKAIIERAVFEEVQQMRHRPKGSQKYKTTASENIFKGKLACGHCGRALKRQRNSEDSYSYKCPTRSFFTEDACIPVVIEENLLRQKMLHMLSTTHSEMLNSHNQVNSKSIQEMLVQVQRERKHCQQALNDLYESLLAGDICSDDYKEGKTTLTAQINQLIEKEKQLYRDTQQQVKQQSIIGYLSEALPKSLDAHNLTSEIMHKAIEKVYVFQDKSLDVKFTFMDNKLSCRELIESA